MQIPVIRENQDSSIGPELTATVTDTDADTNTDPTMPAFIPSSRRTASSLAPASVQFHPQPVQPPPQTARTTNRSAYTPTITIPQTLDSTTWYRIHNKHATFPLDVVNDGQGSRHGNLTLAHIGNYSGQHWQITPFTATQDEDLTTTTYPPIIPPNTYTLRTLFLGPLRRLATDHTTRNKPHLSELPSSHFSSSRGQQQQQQQTSRSSPTSSTPPPPPPPPPTSHQQWTITLHPDGRSFKLQNLNAGPELCLDTRDGGPGNEVYMAEVDDKRLSQRWYFTPIGPVEEDDVDEGERVGE